MNHSRRHAEIATWLLGFGLVAAGLTGCGSSAGGGTGGNVGSGGQSTGGAATGGQTATGGTSATGGSGASGTGGVGTGGTAGGSSTGGTSGTAGRGGSSGGGAGRGGDAGRAGTGGTGGGAGTRGATGGAGGAAAAGGASGTTDTTIVPDPSWACGMTAGIAPPARGTLVFRATMQVSGTQDVGTTQYGHRRVLDVSGGTVTGSKLNATVQKGGYDFELTLTNGVVELEQIDVLKASDGTMIFLRTCGVAPPGASEVRIVPDFEVATSSGLAWLNTGKFAGTRTVDATGATMQVEVYDISTVTAGSPTIQIAVPAGATPQPWDCSTATGAKGASVFTENVTLGSSFSIAGKRGTRNIIPITGGSVSGKVTGTVLYGGGDYQLASGTTTKLDARYVISAGSDTVIVRNCGPFGALVPLFETRADGPYAFLNANTFVSSDPGSGAGGVGITFYQRQ